MRKLELKLQAVVAWVFLMRFQSIWVHGFISNSPLSPASPPIAVLEDNPFAPSPGAVVGGGDEDDGHLEMKVLIGLTVVAAVLASLLVSMICLYISRSSRRLAKGRNRQSDPEQGLSLHTVSSKRSCSNSVGKGKRRVAFVEYETLQSGTNGFSHDSILGGGSLGTVYQAWLEDGSLVAVKRFNAGDADAERQCQLTGFGLAVTANQAQNTESIESSGTPGYVAPEYLQDGTDKSDVYAFGVILLELLFGRKAVEELSTGHSQSIVTWAIPQLTDRSKIPSIVDPVIKDTMELKHLYQVAAVAVLCVQPEPSYRPLITDVLYSLAPLVPAELGGSGRGSYVTTTCHGNAT